MIKLIHRLLLVFRLRRFYRGLGRLAREYGNLSEQTERAAWATKEFGKNWQDILDRVNVINVTEQYTRLIKEQKAKDVNSG